MNIPYRMDSVEAINAAKREGFLGLGNGYNVMLAAARNIHLHHPQALRKAKQFVKKDFTVINEQVICTTDISYEEISDLDLAGSLERIEAKIPSLKGMANHESAFQYVETLPPDVRKALNVEIFPATPTNMLEAHLALHRLVKREILHYLKTERTKSVGLESLKELITYTALFDSRQRDILSLLKQGGIAGDYPAPYQNILAEMLFARIPLVMEILLMSNPPALRRKLLARIDRMDLTARQRMTLYGYCQQMLDPQQMMDALAKMRQVSGRMSLSPEVKDSLKDYLDSMKSHIERISQVYRDWFLDRDLETIRKLHKQGHWLNKKVSYSKEVVRTCTRLATMELYPAKDYLDIFKGVISGDCIGEALGKGHLRESRYFSIRIFMDREWMGNIYMLDFTDTRGLLLIDRIQIPRKLKVLFHRFFDHLREALEDLFADVPYESMIMPVVVSNHEALQRVFNSYRKKLPVVEVDFGNARTKMFESLSAVQNYYVLRTVKTAINTSMISVKGNNE